MLLSGLKMSVIFDRFSHIDELLAKGEQAMHTADSSEHRPLKCCTIPQSKSHYYVTHKSTQRGVLAEPARSKSVD